MGLAETCASGLKSRYHVEPTLLVRAPGRVNLIGEHVDYTGGRVLPFAIPRGIWVAAALTPGLAVRAYSNKLNDDTVIPLRGDFLLPEGHWARYLNGAILVLRRQGFEIPSCALFIHSDLPMGQGVSSSAALTVACIKALLSLAGADMDGLQLVEWVRQVERDFAGTPCGIMDPYVSLFGKHGNALLLDCSTRTHEDVPFQLDLSQEVLFLVDSGVRHKLASGAYGNRVRECETALAFLQRKEGVSNFRDIRLEEVARITAGLEPALIPRVRHEVTENYRVLAMVSALQKRDLVEAGHLLSQSHRSLCDDYDVSCAEVELLHASIVGTEGVYGARMIGGGFGGSILVLARREVLPKFGNRAQEVWAAQGAYTMPIKGHWRKSPF